jgi:hypothetical protein
MPGHVHGAAGWRLTRSGALRIKELLERIKELKATTNHNWRPHPDRWGVRSAGSHDVAIVQPQQQQQPTTTYVTPYAEQHSGCVIMGIVSENR